MGVRGANGDADKVPLWRRGVRPLPVRESRRQQHGSGVAEHGLFGRCRQRSRPGRQLSAEWVGAVRHARQRLGVGGGLVWRLSRYSSHRSPGSSYRHQPGPSRRGVAQHRRLLPYCESRPLCAWRSQHQPRISPGENLLTLSALPFYALRGWGIGEPCTMPVSNDN